MRWREAVNVHYDRDFRRQSLVQLAKRYVCGPRALDMRCITGTLAVELAVAGEDMMGDIAQTLKSGGRLILNAPAFPALLGKRDRSPGHLRRYTRRALASLLKQAGLRIRLMRYWNFAALAPYVVIEKVLSSQVPEPIRYGYWPFIGSLPNRALRWWYVHIENRLPFPAGLSLFVIAHKGNAHR